jgi:hypothetical protein
LQAISSIQNGNLVFHTKERHLSRHDLGEKIGGPFKVLIGKNQWYMAQFNMNPNPFGIKHKVCFMLYKSVKKLSKSKDDLLVGDLSCSKAKKYIAKANKKLMGTYINASNKSIDLLKEIEKSNWSKKREETITIIDELVYGFIGPPRMVEEELMWRQDFLLHIDEETDSLIIKTTTYAGEPTKELQGAIKIPLNSLKEEYKSKKSVKLIAWIKKENSSVDISIINPAIFNAPSVDHILETSTPGVCVGYGCGYRDTIKAPSRRITPHYISIEFNPKNLSQINLGFHLLEDGVESDIYTEYYKND